MNAKSIQEKLGKKEGRAAELAANNAKSDEEKIHERYIMAFAREPDQRETQVAVSYLQRPVAKDQNPEEQKSDDVKVTPSDEERASIPPTQEILRLGCGAKLILYPTSIILPPFVTDLSDNF